MSYWPSVTIKRDGWSGIQEAIDWLVNQRYWFERSMVYNPLHLDDQSIVVRFTFQNNNDAMMFKLTWGGR